MSEAARLQTALGTKGQCAGVKKSNMSEMFCNEESDVMENGFHSSTTKTVQGTSLEFHSEDDHLTNVMSNCCSNATNIDLRKSSASSVNDCSQQNPPNHDNDGLSPTDDNSSPQTLSSSLGSADSEVADLNCLDKVNECSHNSKISMKDVIEKVSDLTDTEVLESDSNGDSGICSGNSCQCSDKEKETNNDQKISSEPNTCDSTSSEVDVMLNKLEQTTLTTVNSCHCDGDVINGISYIVYESEKQMPNIMRLITKDLSEPYSIYTYRYFIHNWPKLCFLAMADNKCVGAIVCKLDLHKKMVLRGYIAMLAVDSQYRRRQIGSTLVTKAIQAMIRDDCDEVVLETEITNRAALHLYENLGFVRDKRLFRYYLNGVDALRLKLWLR